MRNSLGNPSPMLSRKREECSRAGERSMASNGERFLAAIDAISQFRLPISILGRWIARPAPFIRLRNCIKIAMGAEMIVLDHYGDSHS